MILHCEYLKKTMYRLLIPVDGSVERAENQARFAASFPCGDESIAAVVAHAPTDDGREEPRAVERVESVEAAVEILDAAGIECEIAEIAVPPEEGIFELASETSFDAIVMGGRKRSPAEKAILGSVTQKVILNTDTPVVVTGGGRGDEID